MNTKLSFLKDCLDAILAQTLTQWECIVIDGFSTNGSWEFLSSSLKTDQRFSLYQKPRRGIYNAWNEGIKLAKGKYIYIATSDDTMSPALLETMVSALQEHPECHLAHCCLQVIGEDGELVKGREWERYPSVRFFGDLMGQEHIRYAPHDGILHAFVKTVYHSITQLVIRKSVFEDVGLFEEDSGSIADYEWGLRAGLSCNVLHIPRYLAAWRIHDSQATTQSVQTDPETYKKLIGWVSSNVSESQRKAPGWSSSHDVIALTEVYRANQRYYLHLAVLKRFWFLARVIRKLTPKSIFFSDGVKEAKAYFHDHSLNVLIKPLQG